MLVLGLLLYFQCVRTYRVQQQCRSHCNSDVVGVGEEECILASPYYNHSQWSTCLTGDYVMHASNQRRYCPRRATVCWYQCMLEFHEHDRGPVKNYCFCASRETVPSENLPLHCYSPRGEDCNWYRECLERRYQCEGTDYGYAIDREYTRKNLVICFPSTMISAIMAVIG